MRERAEVFGAALLARYPRVIVNNGVDTPESPSHSCDVERSTLKRMEKIRLYPTPRQEARLLKALDVCRQLYNAALQQRRDAWKTRRLSISHKTQYAQLTALRQDDARVASVCRQCQDGALHKLDLAFGAFFRRLKRGEPPGYPRFRSAARYRCLQFAHGESALRFNKNQTRVSIAKVGTVRLRKGRTVPAFGRAMVVRRGRRWYAFFECVRQVEAGEPTGAIVGIDRGTVVLVATSDGELVANPRHVARVANHMARLQRALERRTRYAANGRVLNGTSVRRRGAVLRLTRAQEHVLTLGAITCTNSLVR